MIVFGWKGKEEVCMMQVFVRSPTTVCLFTFLTLQLIMESHEPRSICEALQEVGYALRTQAPDNWAPTY